MAFFPGLSDKFKSFSKRAGLVYPLIVIITIPLLLAVNTIWNLRSFNRDANFIIRHQAVSIADSLSPIIAKDLDDKDSLETLLTSTTQANEDIVSITVLEYRDNNAEVVASSTTPEEAALSAEFALNQLAIALEQPFAGLSYEPTLEKNVWNVVVPVETDSPNPHLLILKLKTDVVDAILSRTSRDSFIILTVLIIITLILLANHFVFYKRALEAKKLAELDKLKDEFISMASHELRAPVTALVGYLELLREKISPTELPALEENLNTLDGITRDLRDLISDLLEVSRIEQGRFSVELESVQVNDIINHVIETMKPLAKQKNLSISFTPIELPLIKTDPKRIRQVLTNLVNNAVKYSLKGEVNITAAKKGKFVEVTVKDTGIGIPPDQLSKLFSKFHRVKDKQTAEVRGTGLGLWITKQIVETLGGKIYAESIYGTGSSFTFTLPLNSS